MNDPFIYIDSTRAALFAKIVYRELGNEAFWKFHDQLYSEQPADSKYEKIDLYSTSFLETTLNTKWLAKQIYSKLQLVI
jgi:hypothetical protein